MERSMPIPESPIPGPFMMQVTTGLDKLLHAVQWQSSIALASAIMTASGQKYSIEKALEIARDIHFETHPSPGSGAFLAWQKNKAERLAKIHGA
jgi:hypothetical protein